MYITGQLSQFQIILESMNHAFSGKIFDKCRGFPWTWRQIDLTKQSSKHSNFLPLWSQVMQSITGDEKNIN